MFLIRSNNSDTLGFMDMSGAIAPRKGRGAASNDSGRFEAEQRVGV